ncbi:MAG: Rid family hydrolase [Nocardioides sp.]|uniref:Rid family hydrolase n=1 Tax=Nocardioides sp. TaxID=35761 RepID=UPI0039E39999
MNITFVVPEDHAEICARWHMSAAVRTGNRVDVSGQGGWAGDSARYPESLAEEIANAFENLGRVLALAGATWSDVVKVTSYHRPVGGSGIGAEHLDAMNEQMARHMPDRQPIWTCVGVPVLGEPEMRVEIRVTAVIASEPAFHEPSKRSIHMTTTPSTTFTASEEYKEACNANHMSQAFRVGNWVETSGHGGEARVQGGDPNDWTYPSAVEDQIANAFGTLTTVLADAGASWDDVTEIISYHVPTAADMIGRDHLGAMVEQMQKHMPGRHPAWTCVGVAALGEPQMKVEIRILAHVDG